MLRTILSVQASVSLCGTRHDSEKMSSSISNIEGGFHASNHHLQLSLIQVQVRLHP